MNLTANMNEREKKFILYGAVIAVLIIGYYLFSWYGEIKEKVSNVSDERSYILRKQINRLAKKEETEMRLQKVRESLEDAEKMVLRGKKPPVAAAVLQKLLKENARSLKIDVKLERALDHVETEYYLAIPVEIGFTTTTKNLQDLLLKLRNSSYLLTVSQIKVRVTNLSKPEGIYTTLVVTGFIKREAEGKSDKKETGNAA